ncbi:MAG: inositol-phosphate phosphatase [Gammaproteobacteria bacterium]|nr:inositol-phosphate phosphatase [Gammaproteobacteria bacterium]
MTMEIPDLQQALQVALSAADQAAEAIDTHQSASTRIELKADQTPVTVADRAAEQAIREVLQQHYPEHAIYGEEYGDASSDAQRDSGCLWLLDPIDGTKSWIAGLPFWSIQIALMVRQQLVLGVSSAPAFAELACASNEHASTLNRTRIHCSAATSLSACRLSLGNISTLAADPARWRGLADIISACNRVRGYGDFYHYHRLAAGQLDAVLESDVNILDVAALQVIVSAAGGIMTDMHGQPLQLDSTTVLAAATAQLHETLLTTLHRHV